jgi:Fe-S-cluster containining protein
MDHRQLVLDENSEFNFQCHDGLDCFKKCCRDINIYLSPYDVLRMKNYLGISSGEFLKQYTLKIPVHRLGFAVVQIKMMEEDNLKCPFITPKGCRVYPERPWACRIAPVEMLEEGKYTFCFDSSRCHGLKEPKTQTINEWLQDQGLEIYKEMEQGFNEIPLRLKLTGDWETDEKLKKLIQIFYMASYDLDNFREFILNNPSLCEKMNLTEEQLDQIRQDDVKLMKFGIKLMSPEPGHIIDL